MKTLNILVAQGRNNMPGIAELLRRADGAEVTRCSGEEPDGSLFGARGFDLLLIDLRNSHGEFPPVAEAFRRACPRAPVLVATGESAAGMALEALRRGTCHFVVQPRNDVELGDMVHRVARGAASNGGSTRPEMPRAGAADGRPTLYEMERNYILRTLEECKWNKKKTASVLGINRSSLYSKIKRFGIGGEVMN